VLTWLPLLLPGPELVSRAGGDVKDHIGRPVECGQLAAVDSECRAIALQLYDGQLKVRCCVNDMLCCHHDELRKLHTCI
jgi:hypothetical protein